MNIEQVKENILNLERVNCDNFHNEVISAFEDYEFEGETLVIVTSGESGVSESPNKYLAYINKENSPQLLIDVEYSLFSICVTEVTIIY